VADVNARIHVGIDASSAIAQLRSLQSQLSAFNASVVKGNTAAVASQQALTSALVSQIGATGKFTTSIRSMDSGISAMQQGFDKGTLSARQYFRYAGSQVPLLSRAFRGLGAEQAAMTDLATQRVKRLQTQYISLGRDAQGVQKVLAAQPKTLASGYATQVALATQKQQLFTRALQLGSTQIVNWGKNTQWAGRQLMVGFTVPLGMAAAAASKFFKDLEAETINFKKVYGDIFTTDAEVEKNLSAVKELSKEFTKYGIAVSDSMALANIAAQAGQRGADLMDATTQATRLSVLGQMESQDAMKTTISLQTAFGLSSEKLAEAINFLNVVENQSVLSLQDVAGAIPRVAPVIQALGGDVKDMAALLVAMKEGGVSAAEGANALKSSLGRLITPTRAASDMARGLGINLEEIVTKNQGQVMPMVIELANAMKALSGLEQQQLLSQIFGKFQYARIGALFSSITDEASQANRIIELMGMSTEELASTAEKELSVIEESVSAKFTQAIEKLKVAIAPIGETFLKAITPIISAVASIADAFNNLPDGVKNVIGLVVGAIGLVAPAALMMAGLIGNAIGNAMKFVLVLRNGFKGLQGVLAGTGGSFKYQSGAALDSAAAMASLEGKVTSLTGDLLIQEGAVKSLIAAYRNLAGAASSAAAAMPRGFGVPGVAAAGAAGRSIIPPIKPIGMATGGLVPGTGNKDTVPAMLTPGESVITKEATAKYGPVLAAMNAGTLPGFNVGVVGYGNEVAFMPKEFNLGKRYPDPLSSTQLGATSASLFARAFAKTTAQETRVAESVFRRTSGVFRMFSDNFTSEIDRIKDSTGRAVLSERELVTARTRAAAVTSRQIQMVESTTGRKVLSGPLRQQTFAYMGIPGYESPVTTLSRVGSGHADPIGRGGVVKGVTALRGAPGGATTQERLSLSYRNMGPGLLSWLEKTTGIKGGQLGHIGESRVLSVGEAERLVGGRLPSSSAAMRNIENVRAAAASGERYSPIGRRIAGQTAGPEVLGGLPVATKPVQQQIISQMSASGAAAGTAFGTSLVSSSAASSTPMPARVLSATGHGSPAPIFGAAGQQDGQLYGKKFVQARDSQILSARSLQDIPRVLEQRRVLYGDDFGPPGGPVSNIADRPVPRGPSDNLSASQMARGRAKIARRQFFGSLGGLTQVIMDGPVADITKFAKQEVKTFTNQMRSALGGIKKGFGRISEAAKRVGQNLNDAAPSAYKGMPTMSEIGKKAKALPIRVLDKALPAAINAMDRGADRMRRLGRLASDMP